MRSENPIGFWELDWLWGIPMVAVSIAIHAVALALMGMVVAGPVWRRFGKPQTHASNALVFIGVATGFGYCLALLHLLHALVWAAAFVLLGAIGDFAQAIEYSLTMITTLGSEGTAVKPEWRLMGGIEATAGTLLFGFSTAALFAVMLHTWLLVTRRGERPEETGTPLPP